MSALKDAASSTLAIVHSRGFTLVELVVVIALLATIAVVVGPTLVGHGDEDAQAVVANRLARLIRVTRTTGLEQGAAVTLTLDATTGRYAIERGDGSRTVPLEVGRVDVPQDVALAGDQSVHRFAFDRVGSAAAESVLVRGTGATMIVGIESWTGEPYVRRVGLEP